MRNVIIACIILLCSCTQQKDPVVVSQIQETYSSPIKSVKVVYKSMIRALEKVAQNDTSGNTMDLSIIHGIDKLYYFDSEGTNANAVKVLKADLDSVVANEDYIALSEITYQGNTYNAYIKSQEDLVSEILILQSDQKRVFMIDIIGTIPLKDVMTNLPSLTSLNNLQDLLPL